MSRIFIWLESSSTLNFVSERDPDEIVQTHIFKPLVTVTFFGAGILEKKTSTCHSTLYMRLSTCIIHVIFTSEGFVVSKIANRDPWYDKMNPRAIS